MVGAEHEGGRVRALRTRVGLREERHGADWVVLATGGFAAGGHRARLALDRARDRAGPARDRRPGPPARSASGPTTSTTHPDRPRAGVAVDAEQRPVDAGGERVFENVLVAGATLAGAEPWREKSGDGISLATGHRAAELILSVSTAATGSPVAAAGS